MTNSMTRYETTFEATQNLIRQIEIGHGEAADLYTSIKDCGVDVSLDGFTMTALYQPKSKWGTNEYYACPCEIIGNKGIVHWSHVNDTGDSVVKMWVSFQKDGKTAYPALYNIGFFATPGFNPSPITPIKEILDFSQYTLLNAPWVLPDELSATEWGIDVHDSLSSLNESVMELDIIKANEETVQNLADSLSAYATKEDATLSAIYSDTPSFSEWTYSGLPSELSVSEMRWVDHRNAWSAFLVTLDGGGGWDAGAEGNDGINSTVVSIDFNNIAEYGPFTLVASRSRNAIGYVLGTQTDKPLQPKGDYTTINEFNTLSTAIVQVSNSIPYSKNSVQITQNNQLVFLENREVKGVVIPSDSVASTVILGLPTEDNDGYVTDFIVDFDNQMQNTLSVNLNGDPYGTLYWYSVDDGETLEETLTMDAEKITRLYFTTTGVKRELNSHPLPVLHISKKVIEVVGHSEVE